MSHEVELKIQKLFKGLMKNKDILDDVLKVKDEDAFNMSRRLAKEEGIFAGISAGAAVSAALEYAENNDKVQKILVILPDTGERYLSTDLWNI